MLQDIRVTFRDLLNGPGFAAAAILSLTLGIGANTAIFSVVNGLLLRPLPVERPDELMRVYSGTDDSPYSVASYPDYSDVQDTNRVFSGITAFGSIAVTWNAGSETELLQGMIVSGNYFDVLGVKPAIGRFFARDEDRTPGTHPVVVLSHSFWQSRFGGERNVIGRTMILNAQPFTVIGVAPQGFTGTELFASPGVFVPVMMQHLARPPRGGFAGGMDPDLLKQRGPRWLSMIARLRPETSGEQAQTALRLAGAQLAQAYPETNRDWTFTTYPLNQTPPGFRNVFVPGAALLMTVVGLVLLIACANVANLLLAKGSARRKEIATRMALGAGRRRVIRQLMSESVVLALLGGFAGVLLALWTTDGLSQIELPVAAGLSPAALDFSLDARVLLFAGLVSILTGALFGIIPALSVSRTQLVTVLKDVTLSAPRRGWMSVRNLLVVFQVALSVLLLIGSGLFVRSLQRANAIDPGFDPDNMLVVSLNINLLSYSRPRGVEFYRDAVERVEALPGVRSAAIARVVPLGGGGRRTGVLVPGQDNPDRTGASASTPVIVGANVIGPRYLETMGVPLLRGRGFAAEDVEEAPRVAIINESMARRFWPNDDALGKTFRTSQRGPETRVIGIVKDEKYFTLGEETASFVYLPLSQNHETGMSLHIRTAQEPTNLIPPVRQVIRELEPNLPLFDFRTMNEQVGTTLFPARLSAMLLAVFGAVALALAAVGLYGVMSYSAARRTHEIGIRMALGARETDVLGMVLREAAVLVGAGAVIGLSAAAAVTRAVSGFLYGISPTDPVTFAGVPVLLAAVALLASYIPARRAAKVDPMTALRWE